MIADDLLFIGLKNKLSALNKSNGEIVWTTQLPSAFSSGFVTVTCDGKHVFAYANGKISCLDLSSGRIVWTNGLSGYGYGIASICLPGSLAGPDTAGAARLRADRQSRAAAATTH